MPYRARNGKFVSRTSPIAVATVSTSRRLAEQNRDRRNRARSNGYHGPLTRSDIVRTA